MVKSTQDILDVIGLLFECGADPTLKCGHGATPKQIFMRYNFKIGAALLGMFNDALHCAASTIISLSFVLYKYISSNN